MLYGSGTQTGVQGLCINLVKGREGVVRQKNVLELNGEGDGREVEKGGDIYIPLADSS